MRKPNAIVANRLGPNAVGVKNGRAYIARIELNSVATPELDDKNLDLALNLLQDADCQLFITSLENLEKYEFDFVIDL